MLRAAGLGYSRIGGILLRGRCMANGAWRIDFYTHTLYAIPFGLTKTGLSSIVRPHPKIVSKDRRDSLKRGIKLTTLRRRVNHPQY